MMRLIAWRVASLPLLLLATAVLVFTLAWISPYDPAEAYVTAYGPDVSAELREQYAAAWGLDQPMPRQFLSWLSRLLQGDLGNSRLLAGQPVASVIVQRAGPSFLLVGVAVLVSSVGGLAAGVMAGAFRGSLIDWAVRLLSYVSVFAPSFWVALLALYVFSVQLGWLPAGGMSDLRAVGEAGVHWKHLILPVLCLALSQHAWFTLYVRNTLLEVLQEEYVRYAQAQGIGRIHVLARHALPNALIPFITLVGTHIPELIGGSVLIESIFGWPGLGSLTREAAVAVDIPLLMAIVLLGATLVVVGSLLADVLYRVVDPRTRGGLK